MHLALTVVAVITAAAPESATATDLLKERDHEIRAALPPSGKPMTPAVREKLEVILTKLVDIEAMAKDVLGKQWDAQTEAKRKEFLDAFMVAFRSALSGEMGFYRETKTAFAPEEAELDRIKVPTKLKDKNNEETSIVYTMKKQPSGWRIVDITIDEVSTVENYRASFGRIVAKEGIDALIARLKKKPTT